MDDTRLVYHLIYYVGLQIVSAGHINTRIVSSAVGVPCMLCLLALQGDVDGSVRNRRRV